MAEENGLLDRIDFVSADGTALPFPKNTFASAGALAIGNMLEKTRHGIHEMGRVLKQGGRLVFDHHFVDADSEGWKRLIQGASDRGVTDHTGFVGTEDDLDQLVEDLDLTDCRVDVLEEIIGDPDRDVEEGPLFPYPNERFRKVMIVGTK